MLTGFDFFFLHKKKDHSERLHNVASLRETKLELCRDPENDTAPERAINNPEKHGRKGKLH